MESRTYCRVCYSSKRIASKYRHPKDGGKFFNTCSKSYETMFWRKGDHRRQMQCPTSNRSLPHKVNIVRWGNIATIKIGTIHDRRPATVLRWTVFIPTHQQSVRRTLGHARDTHTLMAANSGKKIVGHEVEDCGCNFRLRKVETARKPAKNNEKAQENVKVEKNVKEAVKYLVDINVKKNFNT